MHEELSLRIENAFRQGADYREASIEAGCSYQDILDWLSIGDNLKRVELLRLEPAWRAKKKLLEKWNIDLSPLDASDGRSGGKDTPADSKTL